MRTTYLAAALAALLVIGCGGPASIRGFTSTIPPQQASIAVVSLSINDYGGALQGWNAVRTSDLMNANAQQMLGMAEQALAAHYRVVPAPSFVNNPAYQQLAGPMPEVSVPMINGAVMPVFARGRGQLVGAKVDPAVAQQLCQATGTDLIAIIYTEWSVATGGFVPTSKAQTATLMSIYDANGVHVARSRVNGRGERTLGAFGAVVVDENSIGEWVGAYQVSLQRMF